MGGRLSKKKSDAYYMGPNNEHSSISRRKSCCSLFLCWCCPFSLRNNTFSTEESDSEYSSVSSTPRSWNSPVTTSQSHSILIRNNTFSTEESDSEYSSVSSTPRSWNSPVTTSQSHSILIQHSHPHFPTYNVPSTVTTTQPHSRFVNSTSTAQQFRHPPSKIPKTVNRTKPQSKLEKSTSTVQYSRPLVPATVTTTQSQSRFVNSSSTVQQSHHPSIKTPKTVNNTKPQTKLEKSTSTVQHSRPLVPATVIATNSQSRFVNSSSTVQQSCLLVPETVTTIKSEHGLVNSISTVQHPCLFTLERVPETVTKRNLESGSVSSISKHQHVSPSPSIKVPAPETSTKSDFGLINSTSSKYHSSILSPESPSIVSANRIVVFDVNGYIIPSHLRTVNKSTSGMVKTDKFPLRVCFKFNAKERCNFLNYCYRFHVCQSWIRGNCKNDQCPLYHHFNSYENTYLFSALSSTNFGEDELREKLKKSIHYKYGIKENLSESICMDYVLNRCEKETCLSYHIKYTFLWEVKVNNKWLTFPWNQNEEIEKSFCDPSRNVVILGLITLVKSPEDNYFIAYLDFPKENCKIDFNSMTLITSKGTEYSLRRLSTPSDVASFKSVATRWLWYYETKKNEWKFFDNAYVDERLVIPFSDYIETMYLKKESKFIYSSSADRYLYRIINFRTMMDSEFAECGLGYPELGLGRRIKRRPYPIDTNKGKKEVTFRSLWSKEENSTVRRRPVEPTSPEFCFVKKLLTTSISVHQIHIERIENCHLWNAYQQKKSLMMEKYGNDLSKVNEQYLFHGTSEKASEKIPTGNFEWRLYGTHVGYRHGKGAYFANSAKFSDKFASEDDDGYKYMFVAMVLIGTAAVGNEEMSYPPVNPSTQTRFDSTVDGVNPRSFVKYNSDEYYPAYMVKYKTISSKIL